MKQIDAKIDALKELAEKVEAGTLSDELSPHYAKRGLWSNSAFQLDERRQAHKAYNGSLDAAHSLHKAVLGDRWTWALYDAWEDGPHEAQVELLPLRHDQPTSGRGSTPARAWLLAIIKAKISELGGVL